MKWDGFEQGNERRLEQQQQGILTESCNLELILSAQRNRIFLPSHPIQFDQKVNAHNASVLRQGAPRRYKICFWALYPPPVIFRFCFPTLFSHSVKRWVCFLFWASRTIQVEGIVPVRFTKKIWIQALNGWRSEGENGIITVLRLWGALQPRQPSQSLLVLFGWAQCSAHVTEISKRKKTLSAFFHQTNSVEMHFL